jgi:hypothetical protein
VGAIGRFTTLTPLVYRELHKRAHHYLRAERPGHTLQSTALVHEASGKDFVHIGREQGVLSGHDARSMRRAPIVAGDGVSASGETQGDRRLSAVLLHPRGRKRGSGGLREEQELLITGQIRKLFLTREDGPWLPFRG